ncbi:MAG: hypothetical protein U1F75_03295 [Plasticicumulans sp.]
MALAWRLRGGQFGDGRVQLRLIAFDLYDQVVIAVEDGVECFFGVQASR